MSQERENECSMKGNFLLFANITNSYVTVYLYNNIYAL